MRSILVVVGIVVIFFAVLLQWRDGSFSDREDRVNAAVPPSPAVISALEDLKQRSGGTLPDNVSEEFHTRMRLRALKCSQDVSIGFATSKTRIHTLLGDSACITEADASVVNWIGSRTIGLVAQGAAVRSADSPTRKVISPREHGQERVIAAADAAVVAITTYKDTEIIGLNDGQVMSAIPHADNRVLDSISPNGRVVAISAYQDATLELHDTTTGALISTLKQANIGMGMEHLYWLDDRVALTQMGSPPRVVLQDFKTDKQYPAQSNIELGFQIVAVPMSPNVFVGASNNSVVKFRLSYVDDVPRLEVLDLHQARFNLTVSNGGGITPDGKYLVNSSNGDLLITPTESLETQTVSLQPFFVRWIAPTGVADQILVTGWVKNSPNESKLYIYSISNKTMAEVTSDTFSSKAFIYLPSVKKIANVVNDGLVLQDSLATGGQVSTPAFIEQAQAQYDAKLAPIAGLQPFEPRDAVAGFRSFSNSATSSAAPQGFLSDLAADAEIQGVGVYQVEPSRTGSDQSTTSVLQASHGVIFKTQQPPPVNASANSIHVRVRPTTRPLILVLSSFDPVHWVVNLDPGARLKGVLLSSARGADVTGQGGARVVTIGSVVSYQPYSPEYDQLQKVVLRTTGKQITQFQGSYKGSSFIVGGAQ